MPSINITSPAPNTVIYTRQGQTVSIEVSGTAACVETELSNGFRTEALLHVDVKVGTQTVRASLAQGEVEIGDGVTVTPYSWSAHFDVGAVGEQEISAIATIRVTTVTEGNDPDDASSGKAESRLQHIGDTQALSVLIDTIAPMLSAALSNGQTSAEYECPTPDPASPESAVLPLTLSGSAVDPQTGVARVAVGVGDVFQDATPNGSWASWSAQINLPNRMGNHDLTVRAWDNNDNTADVVLSVKLVDRTPPILTLDQPPTLVRNGDSITLNLGGTAHDLQTGISQVKVTLKNGKNRVADGKAVLHGPHGPNQKTRWSLSLPIYGTGDLTILVEAADRGFPTATTATVTGTVSITEDESSCCAYGTPSVLDPGAYLIDLSEFLREAFTKFSSLEMLEQRFYRPLGDLGADRATAEEPVLQVEVANEVLEGYLNPTGSTAARQELYAGFTRTGAGYPKPGVLGRMLNLALGELRTTRAELAGAFRAAYPASGTPSRSALDALLTRIGLTETDLTSGLGLSQAEFLTLESLQPGINVIDRLPALLRTAMTRGIDSGDPMKLPAYEDALSLSRASIDRVKQQTLADVRANLIHAALSRESSSFRTERELGNHLHTDLSSDATVRTTRLADAIEALQSFILAWQLGREGDVQLTLDPEDFDARWSWLQSYSLWHAAQSVYFYPENFTFPDVRNNRTPQFNEFLERIRGADADGVLAAADAYEKAITRIGGTEVGIVATVNDRVFLFSYEGTETLLVAEQLREGSWSGWRSLPLPGHKLAAAAGFNGRIYLFFHPEESSYDRLKYTWFEPDSINPAPLESTGALSYSKDISQIFGVAAGPEHLAVYFSLRGVPKSIYSGVMDLHNQWRPAVLQSHDNLIHSHVRVIGHANGSDYLLTSEPSKLWLLRIEKPNANIWDSPERHYSLLADQGQAAGYHNFEGTVHEGQLVVRYTFYILENNAVRYLAHQMARFPPGAVSRPWRAVDERMLGASDHGRMASAWGHVLVYTGATAVDFEVTDLGLLPTGSFRTWFWPPWATWGANLFVRHPLRGRVSRETYRTKQTDAYGATQPRDFVRLAMDEWYCYLPLAAARALGEARAYREAEEWLGCVFHPYQPSMGARAVWAGFSTESDEGEDSRESASWLRNPFNPHALARIRRSAYLRHTVYQYIDNLLEWAEVEFVRDTRESLSRARELYELADDILHFPEVPQNSCEIAWRELVDAIHGAQTPEELRVLQLLIAPVRRGERCATANQVRQLTALVRQDVPFASRVANLKAAIEAFPERGSTLAFLAVAEASRAGRVLSDAPARRGLSASTSLLAAGSFMVPENPILATLRLRIMSNLEKLRTGRNFAGMRRAVSFYATPSDSLGLVQRSTADEALSNAIPSEPPPIYRFSYLIERARYYVSIAQQLESLLLASFEKGDAAQYDLIKARQDLRAAQANLSLQALRVQEASDGVALAQSQRERAEIQRTHFETLLAYPRSEHEDAAISELWTAHNMSYAATVASGASTGLQIGMAVAGMIAAGPAGAIMGMITGGLSSASSAFSSAASLHSTKSQIQSMEASFERREQEWGHQKNLADKDVAIGEHGVTLANDHFAITQKEQAIAELHSEFAAEVLNFLSNKFTNKQLYDWMARIVSRYYREHLNFATVTARMAQTALAFERQEAVTYIAPHYTEREKKDLLVAERLLTDINRLDQHRLTTERRRKELTKTISLSRHAPLEFQQLRSEGWMTFATLMEWFDRDFPGHYLRLIKSLSVTVVGLIPPGEGVKATLSNPGISRAMVGPPFDRLTEIHRQPESISVTAPNNGTGLFELRFDDPILLPFEGCGVETIWTLEMPKAANRFDYGTLADVLITINYTAMEDLSYRDQVVERLGNTVEGMNSFSVRTSFADAWYHLHNPVFGTPGTGGCGPAGPAALPPYTMEFEVGERDFVANEEMQAMRRLNMALRQQQFVKVPLEVEFQPHGASERYRVEAEVAWDADNPATVPLSIAAFSHRRGAEGAWEAHSKPLSELKPMGRWRIRLRNEVDPAQYPGLFSSEPPVDGQRKLDLSGLEDALFVVTYQAGVEYKFAR